MIYKAADAPITFEEIVMVMIKQVMQSYKKWVNHQKIHDNNNNKRYVFRDDSKVY